jgi:pantetheine-phosphate adenylyltransferase
MKVALFPGSFDPITIGHEDLIKRAVPLFDIIIVAIGINSTKKYQYSIEQRIEFLKLTFSNYPTIEITPYEGLTIDFCQSVGAQYILRGIRNSNDYLYENSIAQMNKAMDKDIETIFFPTTPALSAINSTIVRDIINNNGDASQFVPQVLRDKI